LSSTPVWIEAVSKLTPEIHEALSRLLPQLNPKLAVPDRVRLDRLVEDPDVVLLVARDGGRIVGTTTVIVYTTRYGSRRGWTRSSSTRPRAAREWAKLLSRREAAHRLYERLGFEVRDSDVFRIVLE